MEIPNMSVPGRVAGGFPFSDFGMAPPAPDPLKDPVDVLRAALATAATKLAEKAQACADSGDVSGAALLLNAATAAYQSLGR